MNIKKEWIYDGDFTVTMEMVNNGKMIKSKIPDKVTGSFKCSGLDLTTLKNCPKEIVDKIDCSFNHLKTLKYCPSKINGDFYCAHNYLTTLKHLPKELSVSLRMHNNNLKSLVGGPIKVEMIYTVDSKLEIERDFIMSGFCTSIESNQYWSNFLQWMIDQHIELSKVEGWPKNFLSKKIKQSTKSINKFNL